MDPHPNPPRWVPDPTGRHQYRYWDGDQWTDHVADNGVTGSEPVTATGPVAPSGSPAYGGWGPAGPQYQPYPPSGPYPQSGGYPPSGPFPQVGGYPPSGGYPPMAAAPWLADSTKVMGRRYGAFFIDLGVMLAIFAILVSAFTTQRTVAQTLAIPGCHYATGSNSAIQCTDRQVVRVGDTVYDFTGSNEIFWLDAAFGLLYFGVLTGLTGATLGKLATGIRVVKPDGSIVGIPRAIARWLLLAVDGPLSFFLCGIVTSSVSRGHRRLGDMAAGTYVVAKERVGEPVVI